MYSDLGRMKDVMKIFNQITENRNKGKHVWPNSTTYNIIINMLCTRNHLREARQVFDVMITEDGIPKNWAFTTMISYYTKAKLYNEAEEIYDILLKQNLKHGNLIYTTLINLYTDQKKKEKALAVYQKLLDSKKKTGPSLLQCHY